MPDIKLFLADVDERYAVEFWGQSIFDEQDTRVACNTPCLAAAGAGSTATPAAFPGTLYPGGTQVFSAYLAEPRTYGVTVRARF